MGDIALCPHDEIVAAGNGCASQEEPIGSLSAGDGGIADGAEELCACCLDYVFPMSRLPLLTYDASDPQQQALWDTIVASRGKALDLTTPDGRLAGPFEAFVRRPDLGEHLIKVGGVIRFASSLDPRLLELAITTVGARWTSEFEFWAHSALALDAGIEQSVIDALAAGETPTFAHDDEAAVYRYAIALVTDGHVDQPTYDGAITAVGVNGVVDLTHTIGYYSQISFVLNAFKVPLPPGASPRFNAN
jgi:4-carboxymuconolactone decarboxylase